MPDELADRELLLEMACDFYSPENDHLAVQINHDLVDDLFIPLSEENEQLFSFLGVNLMRIVGTHGTLYAFEFYPEILGEEKFWCRPRVLKAAKALGIPIRRSRLPAIQPINENHLFSTIMSSTELYKWWVLVGHKNADLFFFLSAVHRLRRIWDVLLAAVDAGANVTYFGSNAKNQPRYTKLPRIRHVSQIPRSYYPEAVNYLVRVTSGWPNLQVWIDEKIKNIFVKYGITPLTDSVNAFLGRIYRNLVSTSLFAALAQAVLEDTKPRRAVVNNSSAPHENVLVHLARNSGTTVFEIADAASMAPGGSSCASDTGPPLLLCPAAMRTISAPYPESRATTQERS